MGDVRDGRDIQDAYREGAKGSKTWSGLPLQEAYIPEDLKNIEYSREINHPGEFPFVRGIHANLYRKRLWTRREVCGFGAPQDTNRRLKFQAAEGATGLLIIFDVPTTFGIDADHPRAENEVGVVGVSISSLKDMETVLEGISTADNTVSLVSNTCAAPVHLAQYIAAAEKQGAEVGRLRGSVQNDPVGFRYCGYAPAVPLELSVKTAVDCIEFCARNMPQYYPISVDTYALREQGINAVQEMAFGMAIALVYVQGALERNLNIDSFASRVTFYCSSHIDFFEEIAKLRAARKVWARIMRDKFGANQAGSMQFKFGSHTAGCSLVPQQPLNNVIRVAYEALAAVLAGTQSMHCCSFDEPIAIPTEESQRIALRTQQILAYECGVARVADPLGGSYYVESLTRQMEEEITALLEQIDDQGGMVEAIKKGWVDGEIEKSALRVQKEIDSREMTVVGQNAFAADGDEETPGSFHKVSPLSREWAVESLERLRRKRDNDKVKTCLEDIYETAVKEKNNNLMPPILDAVKAYATQGEIMGAIRSAFGYSYDPLGLLESKF